MKLLVYSIVILSIISCVKNSKKKKEFYEQANNDTIKVIAKLLSPGEGSKIHIAKYEVIKIIKGKLTSNIIEVGYYFYNEYKSAPDTALLTLLPYTGSSIVKDYYIFTDYDQKKGIQKIHKN